MRLALLCTCQAGRLEVSRLPRSWLAAGVTFCFKILFGSGFCSMELNLAYFWAVTAAEQRELEGCSVRSLTVIGNPFLHFHATGSLGKWITISTGCGKGGTCAAQKKNEASCRHDRLNLSILTVSLNTGLGVPVASTTHKQTAHSWHEGLAGAIKVIECHPAPRRSLCDRDRLG